MTSSELFTRQEEKLKQLTKENSVLKTDLMELKTEISGIKSKLMDLENKTLECNLIFCGIDEPMNETDDTLTEKLYWTIADTINAFDQAEHLATAKSYTIRKCRHLGKPNPVRPRLISVEFYR